MVPILRAFVVRLTQRSLMSSPSGSPSSKGAQAADAGVAPAAGVIVPRKAPTSVTRYTILALVGSKTAPVIARVGNAVAPLPLMGLQLAPVSTVRKRPE